MPRPSPGTALLTAFALLAACGPDPDRGGGQRTTTYSERVIFIATKADPIVAAVMRFTTRADGAKGIERTAFGWISAGNGWDRFMAEQWRDTPVLEPGRILPHAELRLLVGAGGSIEALVHDGERGQLRLEAGDTLAAWRNGPVRLALRRARLRTPEATHEGAALFAGEAGEVAADGEGALSALLTDGRIFIVLDRAASGASSGLVIADSVTTLPVLVEDAPPEGDAAGRRWAVTGRTGTPFGQLHGVGESWSAAADGVGIDAVHGTIKIMGRSRQVTGVVERGG